jgi:hypothetical protein
LPRLWNGTSTITDWNLLLTRIITSQNREEFSKAISIYNENADVNECNLKKLAEKKDPITELLLLFHSVNATRGRGDCYRIISF